MTVEPTVSYQALADYLRETTHAAIARHANIQKRSAAEMSRRGWIRLTVAERIADHLHCHPAEIWPEYVDVVCGLSERMIRRAERRRAA